MNQREKVANSSFVQSGNFEVLPQTGFEPGTLRVTAGPLIHYNKLPYTKILKFFKTYFKRYLQSFCGRVASRLEQQSAISFEKTKNKKRLYLFTQTKFFHEVFRNV